MRLERVREQQIKEEIDPTWEPRTNSKGCSQESYQTTIRNGCESCSCLKSFFNTVLEKIASFFQWIFTFCSSAKSNQTAEIPDVNKDDVAVSLMNWDNNGGETYQVHLGGKPTDNKIHVVKEKSSFRIVDFEFTDRELLKNLGKIIPLIQQGSYRDYIEVATLEHAQILWKAGLRPQGKVKYDPDSCEATSVAIKEIIGMGNHNKNMLSESGLRALDRIEKALPREMYSLLESFVDMGITGMKESTLEIADVLELMNALKEEAVKGIPIQAKIHLKAPNN